MLIPREVRLARVGFFFALMGLIMTITCMSLTNMLIARGANRRRELAIRLAVGAGRFRLIRQMMPRNVPKDVTRLPTAVRIQTADHLGLGIAVAEKLGGPTALAPANRPGYKDADVRAAHLVEVSGDAQKSNACQLDGLGRFPTARAAA